MNRPGRLIIGTIVPNSACCNELGQIQHATIMVQTMLKLGFGVQAEWFTVIPSQLDEEGAVQRMAHVLCFTGYHFVFKAMLTHLLHS